MFFVNVYAPNWDDVDVMSRLFYIFPDLDIHKLLFEGDLNCVVDPMLDWYGATMGALLILRWPNLYLCLWRKMDVLILGDLGTLWPNNSPLFTATPIILLLRFVY